MLGPRVFSFPKRRRVAPHSDAAPFRKRAAPLLLAGTFFSLLPLAGCSLLRTSSTQSSSTQTTPAAAQKSSQQTSSKQPSLLSSWISALTQKPSASPTATAVVQPKVFIDVTALAQRFPAWQLAARLDNSQTKTVSLVMPRSSTRSLAEIVAPSLPFSALRVLDTAQGSVPALRSIENGAMRQSSNETSLQEVARRRSDADLNNFLRDASVRRAAAQRAQESEARATLEDDVAAAREVVLPPLEPIGLPPEVQLEITNLRLKLLPNSNTSAIDREAAQARLFQLQEVWREKLRAQEQQILDEWTRQREEEPLRVRREGEAQIAVQTEREQRISRARLVELRDEQTRFLANDFNGSRSLVVVLPPFSTYEVRGTTIAPTTSTSRETVAFPARLPQPEITAPMPSFNRLLVTSAGTNGARATQLRLQALQGAHAWAQNLARSRGWVLVERPVVGVRDETPSALQMLGVS